MAALCVPVFLHTHMHAVVAAFNQVPGSESTGPEPSQYLVKFVPKCCELSVLIIPFAGAGLNEIRQQSCQLRARPGGDPSYMVSGKTLVSVGIWVSIYTQRRPVVSSGATQRKREKELFHLHLYVCFNS